MAGKNTILQNPEVNKRIRYLREELIKIKQGTLAENLGIKQASLSDIENMRTNPSNRVVRDLVMLFNVNENWLRDGAEPIFNQMSKEEEIAAYMGKVMNPKNDGGPMQKFIYMLSKLDESDWETIDKMVKIMVDENKKN